MKNQKDISNYEFDDYMRDITENIKTIDTIKAEITKIHGQMSDKVKEIEHLYNKFSTVTDEKECEELERDITTAIEDLMHLACHLPVVLSNLNDNALETAGLAESFDLTNPYAKM